MIEKLVLVGLGGAIGAILRFLAVNSAGRTFGDTAWGTAFVNVLGSLLMGLFAVAVVHKMGEGGARLSALLMTGVLGGFTTFSAFSLDAFRLYEAGRHGMAAAYVGGSVALSLVALAIGIALGRSLFA